MVGVPRIEPELWVKDGTKNKKEAVIPAPEPGSSATSASHKTHALRTHALDLIFQRDDAALSVDSRFQTHYSGYRPHHQRLPGARRDPDPDGLSDCEANWIPDLRPPTQASGGGQRGVGLKNDEITA